MIKDRNENALPVASESAPGISARTRVAPRRIYHLQSRRGVQQSASQHLMLVWSSWGSSARGQQRWTAGQGQSYPERGAGATTASAPMGNRAEVPVISPLPIWPQPHRSPCRTQPALALQPEVPGFPHHGSQNGASSHQGGVPRPPPFRI